VNSLLTKYIAPWAARWVHDGCICVRELGADRVYELKSGPIPANVERIGCTGWDAAGVLHHVSLDLDVGHGGKFCYPDRGDAIRAAVQVRKFVGERAEIRASAGGDGIHVRIPIAPSFTSAHAARIARWIAAQTGTHADPSQMGRQVLFFWLAKPTTRSFMEYAPCGPDTWMPPPEATADPVVPPIPELRADGTDTVNRAEAYLSRVEPAISGCGGHNQTYKAACVLALGFNLPRHEALPLLQRWNVRCQPPWSDKDITRKLDQAYKAGGARGYLLAEREAPPPPPAPRAEAQGQEAAIRSRAASAPMPPPPAASPVKRLLQQFSDEIDGTRYACKLPWRLLDKLSMALLPATITILAGPRGAGKSWALVQWLNAWLGYGYKVAILMLEESHEFHLRRALAWRSGNAWVLDPAEVARRPSELEELTTEHDAWLNSIASCIFMGSPVTNTQEILRWMGERAAEGYEIIVVDPISVRDDGGKGVWVDDKVLMAFTRDLVEKSQCRVIFSTHPPKKSGDKKADTSGGAAIENLASTVLVIEPCKVKSVEIVGGRAEINRTVRMSKTRSGKGDGQVIGMWWDSEALTFSERGVVK
jgi:hypothetical protein